MEKQKATCVECEQQIEVVMDKSQTMFWCPTCEKITNFIKETQDE